MILICVLVLVIVVNIIRDYNIQIVIIMIMIIILLIILNMNKVTIMINMRILRSQFRPNCILPNLLTSSLLFIRNLLINKGILNIIPRY